MVFSLMVLAALTAIVASFAATHRVEVLGAARRNEKVRARRMAESAIARALAELQLQTLDVPATMLDPWAVLGGQFASERHLVGEDSYRVQIVDASSLVNLNTATQDQLYRLPLTTEQVDSLLDWREGDPAPRPEGAKDEYYTQLPNPYITAMRGLLSFDELLLIKGFNVATLYEPPTEEQPNPFYVPGTQEQQPSLYELATVESQSPVSGINGVNKANINNASQQQMVQAGIPAAIAQAIITRRNQGTFTRIGEVLQVPGVSPDIAGIILDNFVIGGGQVANGKININTASESVLASIPGITADIAASIVSRQNVGYQALSELTTVPGMTMDVLQQTADFFTIGSSMFLIRAQGTAGGTTVGLQVLVSIGQDGPRVLKRIEPPFNDMSTYWLWSAETSADVVVWERQ
jgi:DNA uptake protein ComE-like DNA-binding protein